MRNGKKQGGAHAKKRRRSHQTKSSRGILAGKVLCAKRHEKDRSQIKGNSSKMKISQRVKNITSQKLVSRKNNRIRPYVMHCA